MPKNTQETPQIYHSADMHDLASMAESDMDWMYTALFDVKLRVAQLKKDLIQRHPNTEYAFHSLEKILEIYVYLADNRQQYHTEEAQKFEALLLAEFEANKKAVTR